MLHCHRDLPKKNGIKALGLLVDVEQHSGFSDGVRKLSLRNPKCQICEKVISVEKETWFWLDQGWCFASFHSGTHK